MGPADCIMLQNGKTNKRPFIGVLPLLEDSSNFMGLGPLVHVTAGSSSQWPFRGTFTRPNQVYAPG